MAVTAAPYGQATLKLSQGGVFDFAADTFNIMLLDAAYTLGVDLDEFATDISGNEITGTGYTAGGQALTGLAWTYATDVATLAANTALWTTATFSARFAAVYKDTGTPSTSPLLSYIDFGELRQPAAVDFDIAFGSGLLVMARVPA